jgi:hypothetical protein
MKVKFVDLIHREVYYISSHFNKNWGLRTSPIPNRMGKSPTLNQSKETTSRTYLDPKKFHLFKIQRKVIINQSIA